MLLCCCYLTWAICYAEYLVNVWTQLQYSCCLFVVVVPVELLLCMRVFACFYVWVRVCTWMPLLCVREWFDLFCGSSTTRADADDAASFVSSGSSATAKIVAHSGTSFFSCVLSNNLFSLLSTLLIVDWNDKKNQLISKLSLRYHINYYRSIDMLLKERILCNY